MNYQVPINERASRKMYNHTTILCIQKETLSKIFHLRLKLLGLQGSNQFAGNLELMLD